jgi:ribonuclease HI
VTVEAPTLLIHIDGGSRGNPGDAGFGVYVTDGAGTEKASLYGYIGQASNNVAEYQALLHALRYALAQAAQVVRIYSDSELVVKQMDGRYRVKHENMVPLHREARALMARLPDVKLTHVRREQNKDADRLANQALDEKASRLS